MASISRASAVWGTGRSASSCASTSRLVSVSAAARASDLCTKSSAIGSVLGFQGKRAIGAGDDCLHTRLGLGQFGLAMFFERGAALVGADRVLELLLPGFEVAHDGLKGR